MVKTEQNTMEQTPITTKIERSHKIKKIPKKHAHKPLISKYIMRIEGHRGAGLMEPENTIKSFTKAIELGIDGVELDVWLTADEIPVVVHGVEGKVTLDDRNEFIEKLTLEEIKKAPLPNGEFIPSLKEVFELCKDKVVINVEFKGENLLLVEKVLALINEMNMWEHITISSFYHEYYEKINSTLNIMGVQHRVHFGFLAKRLEEIPDYSNKEFKENDSLNLDIQLLITHRESLMEHINKAKAKKQKIKFYFPLVFKEHKQLYDDMLSIETDTIITNHPVDLLNYLQELHANQIDRLEAKIDDSDAELGILSIKNESKQCEEKLDHTLDKIKCKNCENNS